VSDEGPATVTVHPEAACGIRDGEICRLESPISSMVVRLRYDSKQRPDVALVPKGGHLRNGRCANTLLRARTTDLGEGGALYDEHVRLAPLIPVERYLAIFGSHGERFCEPWACS